MSVQSRKQGSDAHIYCIPSIEFLDKFVDKSSPKNVMHYDLKAALLQNDFLKIVENGRIPVVRPP